MSHRADLVMPPQDIAREIMIKVVDNLGPWKISSVEAFRNVVLGPSGGYMVNPLLDFPDDTMIIELVKEIQQTVRAGRLIHFGFVGNETIKAESIRAHEAFEARELTMPYDNWIATHRWEGGFNAYLFQRQQNPPADYDASELIFMTEIYALSIPHLPGLVGPHDTYLINDVAGCAWRKDGRFESFVPSLRPVEGMDVGPKATQDRLSNMRDPLVCFLRLLADASIPVERIETSERLNKARQKAGKHTLPSYHRVATEGYVTSLKHPTSRTATREDGGGTHASPVAHWRRGHDRHLRSGSVVRVRSSKVNWRSEDDFKRLFYTVKS